VRLRLLQGEHFFCGQLLAELPGLDGFLDVGRGVLRRHSWLDVLAQMPIQLMR
jgi:hypothetical protein